VKTLAKIDVGDGREATIFECPDGSTHWSPGIDVWLSADPEPVVASVPAGTLVAGEMAPGSVSVEVRGAGRPLETLETVVAGGRFLALVAGEHEYGKVFTLFGDERGGIVAPALGEEQKREALRADDVVCPACGGRDWDRVEWRAETHLGREGRRAVLCHTCGHAPMGVETVGRPPRRQEPEFEDTPHPLSSYPTAAEIVEVAPFPVYILEAPELAGPSFAGASWSETGLLSVRFEVRLGEASVVVTSESGDWPTPAGEVARRELKSYLRRDARVRRDDPDRDVTALRIEQARRELWDAIDRVPAEKISLRVGQEAAEAELVEHEGTWSASTGTVTVKARNVMPGDVALGLLRPDDELAYFRWSLM
jgi:hypothetical protein